MKHLFLDLEGTIINSWGNPAIIHAETIKKWIAKEDLPKSVRIFSFAVVNEKDIAHFLHQTTMKGAIEHHLGVHVYDVLSVELIRHTIERDRSFRYDTTYEFMQFEGKAGAFIKFCCAMRTILSDAHPTFILLDDAVDHQTIIMHDRSMTIELVPVQNLPDLIEDD